MIESTSGLMNKWMMDRYNVCKHISCGIVFLYVKMGENHKVVNNSA